MGEDERINLTPAQQIDQHDAHASKQRELQHLGLQPKTYQNSSVRRHQRSEQQDRQEQQDQEQQRNKRNQVQYQLKQVIGKGSYGIVYKAVNKKTQQIVAIKEVNYDNDDELTDIMSEIDLLKNLNHINIVKYHGFIQKSHNLYIILEYCSHGSLKNLISRGNGMDESRAKVYVKQTLNGLHYLHEQGVIHRDIKAANLLLDSNNIVKLADFGVSTQVNTIMMAMTLAGSLNWMAPEIISNRGATTLSDIWSLGATVLELLTGNPPFHNLVDLNVYYAIENDSFIPPNYLSPLAQDFLLSCFQKNMYKRPTALQLLKHRWLSNDSDLNKLELFKEVNNDYKWDQDFKEVNIVDGNIKATDSSTILPTVTAVEVTDLFSEMTIDKPIDQAQLTMLFNDLTPQDLVLKIVKLSQKNLINDDLLISILDYDSKFNDSKVKQYFVKLGGLPTILTKSSIIEQFFIKDCYKSLIQCGIMFTHNISQLSDSLRFELILKYLEASNSIPLWCSWCSKNIKVSELLTKSNLANKSVQSIILKLSFFNENSFWFHQQLISQLLKIQPSKENFDQQPLAIIFKALSSILIQSHKNDLTPPIKSLSISSSSLLSIPSPSTSSPSSPITTSSAKLNRHSNSSFNLSLLPLNLPVYFLTWLLSFLDDPFFYNVKNLHLWKYYVIVIYHATHLNKLLMKNLIAHEKFLTLILKFLHPNQYSNFYENEECLQAIAHQSLSIIVELSNELKNLSPVYLQLSLKFIDFDEDCITGGLEILFNCLQLSLHNNAKNYTEDAKNSSISFHVSGDSEITLHYYELVNPFYKIKEDHIQFGNFITRFNKICSLHPLDFISYRVVLHPNFKERCVSFFQLYRNSLLIQIDLLKLIKLVFLRSFEHLSRTTVDNKGAQKLIRLKLEEMIEFLSNNWTRHETGQVGHDSILIHQLCHDMQSLMSISASALSSTQPSTSFTTGMDREGFVIPRIPPTETAFE